ncbi:hypothetical protein J7E91_01545 [Streptomyces sp. ISL-99]|uniref:hypothetical protein n=1 Tax=Streptomyces sp. ISL-99 TaxID=2819193 RepID=UPI001BED13A6|nr:hypothetical protein [Streptomyces sp. ISL-99]MBT2524147.1 hypothetical protein [Streptomyces sp. ISL-99]
MTATARTQSDKAADTSADEIAAGETEETKKAEAADQDVTVDGSEAADQAPRASSPGVGAGAAAVVSTVLGLAALTGTWVSDVVAERQRIVGQLGMEQTAGPAEQISTMYGDPWHLTALVNGGFALLALVVAAVVLARPAFAAGHQSGWVRSFAWAGIALGALGLLVSAGMYFDLFASMPTPPTAGTGAGAGQ